MTQASAAELRERSIGELLSQLGDDSSLLIRQELQLARAEMTEKATAAGIGIALGVFAALLLLAALACGVTTSIAALSYVVPTWGAALITLGGLVFLALLIGLVAALRLKAAGPPVPRKAIETAKETPGELVH